MQLRIFDSWRMAMKHENEKKTTPTREKTTIQYYTFPTRFCLDKLELIKNGKNFRFSWKILDQDFCEKELSTPAFRVLFICEREDFANIPPCTQFNPPWFLYDCFSIIRFQFFVRFYIFCYALYSTFLQYSDNSLFRMVDARFDGVDSWCVYELVSQSTSGACETKHHIRVR